MADVTKEAKVIKLLKSGDQRKAINVLYDEFNQSELNAFGQIGQRLMSMTDTVATKQAKEAQARKRRIGSGSSAESTFIPAE